MAISRQRKWQLKMVEEGRCQRCGKPAECFKGLCVEHGVYNRLHARKRTGSSPKQPEGAGRPQICLMD